MNRFCQSVDGSEEFLGGSVGAVSFLSGLLFSVFSAGLLALRSSSLMIFFMVIFFHLCIVCSFPII